MRAELATQSLVMLGACRFTGGHPFVRALKDGPEVLSSWYRDFAPKTLAEMYRLPSEGTGHDLSPWSLPWRSRKASPLGECGLSADHGASCYGPCTGEKISMEHQRLTGTANSIRESGYRPDLHGHISGQFLARGNELRFFVSGGKHRAAVLVALGHSMVEVETRGGRPPVIRREESSLWPPVARRRISQQLAESILDRYFE